MNKVMKDQHQQEWLDSTVDQEIIELNVKSIKGDAAYEHLLYGLDRSDRRNDGRLRDYWLNKYRHIEDGGWWCSGINLFTMEESDWGCFKPDFPRQDPKKGKPIKYEHPPKVSTEAFALKVPTSTWDFIAEKWGLDREGESFWAWVIAHHQLPLIITEGAKKAGALLSAGYPAIALPGIRSGYRQDEGDTELIPEIELFCQKWRQITFAFDTDKKYKTVQDVNSAIEKMGEIISKKGCEVFTANWRANDGKGVDDFIAGSGREAWDFVYERRQSLSEFKETKKRKYPNTKLDELMKFIEIELADRLSYNELTMDILFDGQPLDFENGIRCWFFANFKILSTNENIIEALYHFASRNSFHPVKQYLERVANTAPEIDLDTLATRYFETTDPLYNTFLKRWLIGAVARVYEPGVKLDHALILQGRTFVRKSTFLKILGGEWFNSSTVDISDRDGLMVLHQHWIYELSEFDKITSKKSAATIKAFMSNEVDALRRPWGRKTITAPRRFILCGSVNKSDFLHDETGNRRFWIIPIPSHLKYIDTDRLREERDAIWAAAVKAYRKGETYHLNFEEEWTNLKHNQSFEIADEWESEIEAYLQDKEYAVIKEILDDLFKIDLSLQDKRLQWRVSSILTKLGWKKGDRRTIDGKRCVVWLRQEVEKNIFKNSENLVHTCAQAGAEPLPGKEDNPALPGEGIPVHTQESPSQEIPPQKFSKAVAASSERRNGKGFGKSCHSLPQEKPFSKKSFSLETLRNIPGSKFKKYEEPKVEFHPGDRVIYEGEQYEVKNATHTHVQLDKTNKSVPVWQLERETQEGKYS